MKLALHLVCDIDIIINLLVVFLAFYRCDSNRKALWIRVICAFPGRLEVGSGLDET